MLSRNRMHQITLLVFFLLFFLSFSRNLLRVADPEHFRTFAEATEQMIYGRLAYAGEHGIFHAGGLMVMGYGRPELQPDRPTMYQIFVSGQQVPNPWFYRSNPGWQGILFSFITQISPLDHQQEALLLRGVASAISASICTLLLGWVMRTFSLGVALGTGIGLLCSSGLIVSGGHVYWISGLLFWPCYVCIRQLERHKGPPKTYAWRAALWIGIAFWLKGQVLGFELLTCTAVASLIPIAFYAVRDRWTFPQLLRWVLPVSVAITMATTLTAAILLVQIGQLPNQDTTGIAYLQERLAVRTTGGTYRGSSAADLEESFSASYGAVFQQYLHPPVFALPATELTNRLLGRYRVLPFWLVGLMALICTALSIRRKAAGTKALLITTWLSILALPSWLILFKSHAYLHLHLNFLGWYLPFLFFVYILVTQTLITATSTRWHRTKSAD